MKYSQITHPFAPVYNSSSRVLILGSLPSVKSRKECFYYGHPQNRFWRVLAQLLHYDIPCTIEEKTRLLLDNGIALWDVVAGCDIIGSSDASIRNILPTDISLILEQCDIGAIFANGKTAERIFNKYHYPVCKRDIIPLPSTSAANAAWNLERLISEWGMILNYLDRSAITYISK